MQIYLHITVHEGSYHTLMKVTGFLGDLSLEGQVGVIGDGW